MFNISFVKTSLRFIFLVLLIISTTVSAQIISEETTVSNKLKSEFKINKINRIGNNPIIDEAFNSVINDFQLLNRLEGYTIIEDALEVYRNNPSNLLGRIVYFEKDKIDLGGFSVLPKDLDKTIFISTVPKDGLVTFHRIKKSQEHKVSLFGTFDIEDDELIEYSITEVNKAMLDPSTIKQAFLEGYLDYWAKDPATLDKLKTMEYIEAVIVFEFKYRRYKNKGKKISAENIPITSALLSFSNSFYESTERMERVFKVGLLTVPLSRLYDEINAFRQSLEGSNKD